MEASDFPKVGYINDGQKIHQFEYWGGRWKPICRSIQKGDRTRFAFSVGGPEPVVDCLHCLSMMKGA